MSGLPLGRAAPPRAGDAVTFTVPEGRALEVLFALLGRPRGDAMLVPAKLDAPRPALLEAGARCIARSVSRYLCADEGYRERVVLREGRRAVGRAWSPSLGVGFAPRYTRASRSFWLAAAEALPLLGALDAAPEAVRKATRVATELVDSDGTGSGDWVFFAMAHASLPAFRLATAQMATVQRRLRSGSPLAALLYPDTAAGVDELRAQYGRLVARGNVRVVECVEGRLARSWSAYAAQTWAARLAPDDLTARWSALGRTLHGWLDVIDRANRMDLARPLVRAAASMVDGPFAGAGDAVRAALATAPGLRNLAEREALLAAVATVADVGVRLLRRRDELAGERYGDERYDEAQVYVGEADRVLTPARRRVEGVARALSGVIG